MFIRVQELGAGYLLGQRVTWKHLDVQNVGPFVLQRNVHTSVRSGLNINTVSGGRLQGRADCHAIEDLSIS